MKQCLQIYKVKLFSPYNSIPSQIVKVEGKIKTLPGIQKLKNYTLCSFFLRSYCVLCFSKMRGKNLEREINVLSKTGDTAQERDKGKSKDKSYAPDSERNESQWNRE